MPLLPATGPGRWVRLITGTALVLVTLAGHGTTVRAHVVVVGSGPLGRPTGDAAHGHAPSYTWCPDTNARHHRYMVTATKLSCSFADRWVSVLAARRVGGTDGSGVRIAGGPSGYTCEAGMAPPSEGFSPNVQQWGACAKGPVALGSSSEPSFGWGVAVPL